jgi:hypothetical protein
VAVLSSLKYVVLFLTNRKRKKEAPMKQASMFGLCSVLDTFEAVGTSFVATALPA